MGIAATAGATLSDGSPKVPTKIPDLAQRVLELLSEHTFDGKNRAYLASRRASSTSGEVFARVFYLGVSGVEGTFARKILAKSSLAGLGEVVCETRHGCPHLPRDTPEMAPRRRRARRSLAASTGLREMYTTHRRNAS